MKSAAIGFILLLIFGIPAKSLASVRQGVLDLRGVNLDVPIEASGDWEFYWNQLLLPDTLAAADQSKEWMKVPGLWSQSADRHPAHGYATYRLKVRLDQPQRLAIHLPPAIWSSARIFIDHEEIARFGTIGTSSGASRGGIGSKTYEIVPQNAEFDVLIQVSNFEIFLCGMTGAPTFGSLDSINAMLRRSTGMEVFVVGALLIMGIYHLCLYILRREDPSTLWFGSFCLAIGINHSYSIIADLIHLGFNDRSRLYNISWIVSVPFFLWFTYFAFRGLCSRLICWLCSTLAAGYFLLILLTPARVFVDYVNAFHIVTLVSVLYATWVVVRGRMAHREGSNIFLGGMLLVLLATVHDLLAARQIIHGDSIIGLGLLAFILFQSFMIAMRFSKAFVRIRLSETEIRMLSENLKHERDTVVALNSNLENLVEEKTRDIRSIMDHIPLGVFMIKGDLGIHKDHSRSIQDIFPNQDLETCDAAALVFSESTLTSDEKSKAVSTIQFSLGEESFNFEVNTSNLPQEILRLDTYGTQKIFDMTWNGITSSQGLVEKILVTMRDVTDIRLLQERTRHQQEELELIGEIISVSTSKFLRFMQSCHEFIGENTKLVQLHGMKGRDYEVLKILFINMHTIKGTARSFYFKRMTQVFHDVEQYYAQLQKDPDAAWDTKRLSEDLAQAHGMVFHYEALARDKLGRDASQRHSVEFPVEQIEAIHEALSHLTRGAALPPEMTTELQHIASIFHHKLFKPAHEVFDDLLSCLPILARDLHKEVPQIIINTHGILLGEKAEDLLRSAFVHIIRNGMDHGIETAEERMKIGKTARGTLTITMERHDQSVVITYRDDGRGLHMKKLREIGLARGRLAADREHDVTSIANLIFDSGMSTSSQVSDISGRGVGMDAVRRFIHQCGGTVHIALQPIERLTPDFYPFQIIITLPFGLFEASLNPDRQAVA